MCQLVEKIRATYNTIKMLKDRKADISILASEEKTDFFILASEEKKFHA